MKNGGQGCRRRNDNTSASIGVGGTLITWTWTWTWIWLIKRGEIIEHIPDRNRNRNWNRLCIVILMVLMELMSREAQGWLLKADIFVNFLPFTIVFGFGFGFAFRNILVLVLVFYLHCGIQSTGAVRVPYQLQCVIQAMIVMILGLWLCEGSSSIISNLRLPFSVFERKQLTTDNRHEKRWKPNPLVESTYPIWILKYDSYLVSQNKSHQEVWVISLVYTNEDRMIIFQ